ncbi:hypothetical protein [Nitrosovibrio sp. Nv17]|uniref:hypothetical protein n=1 Tax=Nitrosovibrio sp. Nv17 TaxID=1855339 RepID=UPI00116087EC|nr:hypothetical protein [Nitrosovibrio sp. Nv17]
MVGLQGTRNLLNARSFFYSLLTSAAVAWVSAEKGARRPGAVSCHESHFQHPGRVMAAGFDGFEGEAGVSAHADRHCRQSLQRCPIIPGQFETTAGRFRRKHRFDRVRNAVRPIVLPPRQKSTLLIATSPLLSAKCRVFTIPDTFIGDQE